MAHLKIIGHRGARGLAPENTIAGFKKALEYKVDGVEFDVRLTKDGIVVLHHDDALVDKSGTTLKVKDSTYEELKAAKTDLTTLDEAIKAINKNARMHVEIKPGVPIEKILDIIQKAGLKPADFEISSFDQTVLEEVKKQMPEAAVAVLEKWSGLRATRRAKKLGTRTIAMRHTYLWSGFIKIMAMSGFQLWAYTVNDPAKTKKWASYGLYGVTTDYPDRFNR